MLPCLQFYPVCNSILCAIPPWVHSTLCAILPWAQIYPVHHQWQTSDSIGGCVYLLVGPSIHWSVPRSVMIELKKVITSILCAAVLFEYLCVFIVVGDSTSTTSMNVVKVSLEHQVGLELWVIQSSKIWDFVKTQLTRRKVLLSLFEILQKRL